MINNDAHLSRDRICNIAVVVAWEQQSGTERCTDEPCGKKHGWLIRPYRWCVLMHGGDKQPRRFQAGVCTFVRKRGFSQLLQTGGMLWKQFFFNQKKQKRRKNNLKPRGAFQSWWQWERSRTKLTQQDDICERPRQMERGRDSDARWGAEKSSYVQFEAVGIRSHIRQK